MNDTARGNLVGSEINPLLGAILHTVLFRYRPKSITVRFDNNQVVEIKVDLE